MESCMQQTNITRYFEQNVDLRVLSTGEYGIGRTEKKGNSMSL